MQLPPSPPCIIVGQGRGVVVVINDLIPPCPTKMEPKTVNYNHQPPIPKGWLCVKAPWQWCSPWLPNGGWSLILFGLFDSQAAGITSPVPTVALGITAVIGALTAFGVFRSTSRDWEASPNRPGLWIEKVISDFA